MGLVFKRLDDGSKIVMGLFWMHSTIGFSLTDSLLELKARGIKHVDWADWYQAATAAGWTHSRSRQVVEQAINDSGWHQTLMDTFRFTFGIALIQNKGGA